MRIVFLSIFIGLAHLGFAQQDANPRQKIVDSLLNQVESIDDGYEQIKLLTSNAGRMRYTPDTRSLINKAIRISLEKNEAKLLANSYYSLGNFFFFNSQLDSAEVYIDKSIGYVNDETMPFLRATNLMTKSGIYRKRGNISQAIASMLNAQRALDKIDTTSLDLAQKRKFNGESQVLNNSLANYYNQMEEFEKAAEYYEKAYNGAIEIGSFANAGIIMSNKAEMLLNQGQAEKALELFKEGRSLKEKGKVPIRFLMSSDLNIANAQTELGQYDEAMVNINRAILHYKANGPEDNLSNASRVRGKLFLALKQFENAIQDCEVAKSLALSTGNLELTQDAYQCLFTAYQSLGRYEKALENYQELTKTKDSIFNQENIKKQTQLEMQYEFNKTQELNALELEAKERESKLFSYLAILGALLALVLGFFFFKNRKKNIQLAKQKTLLEATIDEKNILLKETHHRVKNSFQIVSSLLYLQSENVDNKKAKAAIKEAENRVRSMVLVHQKLYNKDELVGINTKEYITDLVKDISESHQFHTNLIDFNLRIEPHILDIETITPLGLILNELIINTMKHAFTDSIQSPKIDIHFKKENEALVLNVIDNGKGFEGDIKQTSFGISLMKALSKTLKATLDYQSELGKGTKAILNIHKFKVLG